MRKKSILFRQPWIPHFSNLIWMVGLGMGILFLDFFTKAYVYNVLSSFDCQGPLCLPLSVFQNFLGIDFSINLTMNKGAAWGMFASFQPLLMIIRFLAIMGMLVYLFFFNRNDKIVFPILLVITGAIGNVIDFFLYGSVVDFIHFTFWGYHFPLFNVADSVITIGVIWLCFSFYFTKNSTPQTS